MPCHAFISSEYKFYRLGRLMYDRFQCRPMFLPDPKDGSLYAFNNGMGENSIKKLPFTIPELVTASPCKSSDGILYTGMTPFCVQVWLSLYMYAIFYTITVMAFSVQKGSFYIAQYRSLKALYTFFFLQVCHSLYRHSIHHVERNGYEFYLQVNKCLSC